MDNKTKRVIVIGGGPSGMMAAATAGSRGLEVILLEKNAKLGRKLYLTGKGRCNITNNADVEELITNVPVNGKFLYSAFYSFTNQDLIALLNSLGLETKVERGNRVFPASDKSSDVIKTLERYVRSNNVSLILQEEAVSVISADKRVRGVALKSGNTLECDSVIVATGGVSYPQTGSTGDGYRFASENRHTVIPPKPSLIPLETEEEWPKIAQGLSLKNISLSVLDKADKKIFREFGEMVFTHYGVSGPVILSASCYMGGITPGKYWISIDLKPALSYEELDLRVQRDFTKYSRKHYSNSLNDLLPQKLIPVIIKLSGIPPEKPVHQISRQERLALVGLLKDLRLSIKGCRPIEEAIITSGGVSVDEIDPGTMESKLIRGLFFAGEVIDVNGYTGGFNLHIAFSTGYLAGISC
jgi:predicted Rossmann fold flavoprotein